MKDYRDFAADLVKRAQARGADAVDVFVVEGRTLSLELRLGRLEKLEEAGSEGVGLRAFKNGATALTYTSDLSADSLEYLLDDTMSLVAITDSDVCHQLPNPDLLGSYPGDLALYDPALETFPMERKLELVNRVEEAGRAPDSRINNSNGAWWQDAVEQVTLANSAGFTDHYKVSQVGLGVSLVAEENSVKQTEGWWSANRFLNRLDSAEDIGRIAAERTLRKLGSRPVKTQTVPIVFDPQMGADFLKILFDAVNGSAVYRRNSFLIGKLGEQIGSSCLNIVDDATLVGGLASRPFDGEGVFSSRTEVVKEGRLVNYLCNAYSSAKLSLPDTGSATRRFDANPTVGTTNFYLEPGSTSPLDIIRSVKRGLMVTRLYWVGINLASGDYSRGAEGIWIEDGVLTHPVQEITIAGNMLDMMKRIEVVGNDLEFRSDVASPSFLVSNMVLSGS